MKKKLSVLALIGMVIAFMFWAFLAWGGNSVQVACKSDQPYQLYAGGPYHAIIIQNQTPGTGVYIGPIAALSTTNSGIFLSTATGTAYTGMNGAEVWYCITSSGTATVGVTIR